MAEEETESRILQAWCATKVDVSGKLVSKDSHRKKWGVCEPACQPRKLPEDINNEESKKGGKDSSTVSIVIISITIMILLTSIVTIYYCYVKRNKGEEENNKFGNGYGNIEKNLTEIEGRSFPSAIVIKWSDIKIKSVIGEGNFGRIYQGDIHLNEIQK